MTDADDMAARSKKLAKTILDALDEPEDPERKAYEEQKDREDREALEKFYALTGQTKPKPDTTIASALGQLADRIAKASPVGAFDPVDVSFTAVDGRNVVLRFAPLPSNPDGRYVELRVFTNSGQSNSSQWLMRGSNDELVAHVRRPAATAEVARTIGELIASLERNELG